MHYFDKTFVDSGTYIISKADHRILEAVLGTCVGIAIYDKESRTGGLYHILLSEYPNRSGPFPDEIYANRGLPKFIQDLCQNGCNPAAMEAVVAGGALIGKLSKMDMELDIGGRTLDIATRILKDFNIPIVESETGGLFGVRLQLDLNTFQCKIEPAYACGKSGIKDIVKISDDELTEAIQCIQPIPQIALKIIRTFQSELYNSKDIAAQIRKDQIITAKVLQLCNSAYINTKKEIKSIDQAIMLLGSQIVVRLILASAMENFLKRSHAGYSMTKGGVFHHALAAAIVSEHIAGFTKKSNPGIAYTAGLLHDIGKVLLDQYVAERMPHFYRQIFSDGAALVEAEKTILGITHSEAGKKLAQAWSFPNALIDVIAYHTDPEKAESDPMLTNIVYLANLLLSRFDTCRELEHIEIQPLLSCMTQLGLDAESLHALISTIPWKALNSSGYY